MNDRELFRNIMHYGEFHRMPVWHWTGWQETIERWYNEGLPRDADQAAFFGVPKFLGAGVPVNVGLLPAFEEETLEETDAYRIFRQNDGVIAQHWKGKSCIPHYVDFFLKDRSGWPEYKKRLQPDAGRIPEDIDQRIQDINAMDQPVCITAGSMAGWLRNWMGVHNLAYACCEDPAFVADVVETLSHLVCWCYDQVLPKVKVDLGWGWEDICFRTGPLISPNLFRTLFVPGYKKITAKLREYGCDLCAVDCDGKIDELVPLWLEGGVNVMFPVEIGAWQADPMAFRRRYGKELRIIGGIDKLVLERDRHAIDAEIERRKPLMREGGFVPLPDHLITPGTPLDNYQYYLKRVQELRF